MSTGEQFAPKQVVCAAQTGVKISVTGNVSDLKVMSVLPHCEVTVPQKKPLKREKYFLTIFRSFQANMGIGLYFSAWNRLPVPRVISC